jgi:hypothetical protein
MRPFKIAAIAVGALIALLVVSSVIGLLIWAAVAALVGAVVVLGVKAAFRNKQVSRARPDREVRQKASSVDDEMAQLRREMGDRR